MSIQAIGVRKSIGDTQTEVIKGVSFTIEKGEFVALLGKSGSGKSTLLYLLGTLDKPSAGQILIDGHDVAAISPEALHDLRNLKIGFVFQFHFLLPELTALENVLMPTSLFNQQEARRSYAEELLKTFGLGEKMHRLPRQLSGGEQQRVAIARAMVMKPEYLFADEPTGSLDSVNGERVMELLKVANEQHGTTIVLVTHDADFAAMASRKIPLLDGRVVASEGSEK